MTRSGEEVIMNRTHRICHWARGWGLLALLVVGPVAALTCPTPPNELRVTIGAQVSYDAATHLYTYRYSFHNAALSVQALDSLDIGAPVPITGVQFPRGWIDIPPDVGDPVEAVSFFPYLLPSSAPVQSVTIPPSPWELQPGQTLGGFRFQSPHGPGPVPFYAMGYVTVATQSSEESAEEMTEACGYSLGTPSGVGRMGRTLGPILGISVPIHFPPALNHKAVGLVPVRISATHQLNVDDIDPSSLRFGPQQAVPQAIHRTGAGALVADFAMRKIGLQCWDGALFLYGKTRSGTPFVGAQNVTPVDCPRW